MRGEGATGVNIEAITTKTDDRPNVKIVANGETDLSARCWQSSNPSTEEERACSGSDS